VRHTQSSVYIDEYYWAAVLGCGDDMFSFLVDGESDKALVIGYGSKWIILNNFLLFIDTVQRD